MYPPSRAFKVFSGRDPIPFAEFVAGAQVILTSGQRRCSRGFCFGRCRRGHWLCRRGDNGRFGGGLRGGSGSGIGERLSRGRCCGDGLRGGSSRFGSRGGRRRGSVISFDLGVVGRFLLIHSRQVLGGGGAFEEAGLVAAVPGGFQILAGVDPIAFAVLLLAELICSLGRYYRDRRPGRFRWRCGSRRCRIRRLGRWRGRRLGVRARVLRVKTRDSGQACRDGHRGRKAQRGDSAFVKGPGSVQFLSRRRAETVEEHDVSPERKVVSAALSERNTEEPLGTPSVRHCVRRTCATIRVKKNRHASNRKHGRSWVCGSSGHAQKNRSVVESRVHVSPESNPGKHAFRQRHRNQIKDTSPCR